MPHTDAGKAATAWGGYGFSSVLHWLGFQSWGDVAACLAALYSLLLIIDWVRRKWTGSKD